MLITVDHAKAQRDAGLFFRRPEGVHTEAEDGKREDGQPESGMSQGFPQCGHLALTCRRLFLQAGHETKFP